jgi:ubiquinone/menaquinone biosynthesis C-methylase UbiE
MNQNTLDQLPYFMEWGGKAWEKMLQQSLQRFIGTDLEGKHVLDVGTRYGKMACLFALLGAHVTGVDVNKESLQLAYAEADKWQVKERVEFVHYDGNLDIFPPNTFDIIFTKSVLVVIPDLDVFLVQLEQRLKPGGKVLFLENGRGNPVLHFLRRFWHNRWNYNKARYFTSIEIALFSKIFVAHHIQKTRFPPIYSLWGCKV